jgi:golgi phosphoprotein 3
METTRTPLIVDLPEGLLLLAIDDATGRIETRSGALDYGVAGAVLTELFLQERLTLRDGKIAVVDAGATGDPLFDDALGRIAGSKPRDAKHWVSKLPRAEFRNGVLDRLVDKGVLRREEHRLLWIIPADRYPAEDDSPEQHVREAVRAAVLDGAVPQPRIAVLIGILKACDLLGTVFSKEERKLHRDRIDQIASAELMGQAVSKAVKEMQAATTAAIIAATTAATVTSSSSS